jgi:hypothetical protein
LNRETHKTSTKKSLSKSRPARPAGNLGSYEKYCATAAFIAANGRGAGLRKGGAGQANEPKELF